MNYATFINLEAVTLADCVEMYSMKEKISIIENGQLINFEREER